MRKRRKRNQKVRTLVQNDTRQAQHCRTSPRLRPCAVMAARGAIALAVCLLLLAGIARAADKREDIRTLTFRLRLNSMEPATLNVPAGLYLIHVINGIMPRAGLEIRVSKGNAAIAAMSARKGNPHARALVRLTPGGHVLTISGRPQWQCQITVTN